MKKYFAKYQPIHDRINEEGTNVMFKIDGEWTEPCNFDSFLGLEIEKIAGGVLIICSRDIQVGDKVIHNNPINKVLYNTELTVSEILPSGSYRMKEGGIFFNSELIKVVGEISEDASWVKEGDEFDQEEIEEFYQFTNFNTLEMNKGLIRKNSLYGKQNLPVICKIKGHCGFFH